MKEKMSQIMAMCVKTMQHKCEIHRFSIRLVT